MYNNNKTKMLASTSVTKTNDKNNEMPQWKKDLIARLRNQNKRQLYATGPPQSPPPARITGQQPTTKKEATVVSGGVYESIQHSANGKCKVLQNTSCININNTNNKMVQERVWQDNNSHDLVDDDYKNGKNNSDSDSSEDLHYGPGIVSKLKNKYLSLALRESSTRASILPMRKAASLENILDDDIPNNNTNNRLFQSNLNGKNDKPNRYRNTIRGSDLKRARSVETISRVEDNFIEDHSNHHHHLNNYHHHLSHHNYHNQRPKSLNIDMLLQKQPSLSPSPSPPPPPITYEYNRINRPKRIMPIMNEKEKPPIDVVKQAKLIFERRPEQRTKPPQHTGEVAAKVATYKNIIVQAKHQAKLAKPPIKHKPDKLKKRDEPVVLPKLKPNPNNLPSPIPDISRIDNDDKERLTNSLSETPDLILTSTPLPTVSSQNFRISATENFIKEEIRHSALNPIGKPVSAQSINNINQASSTVTFNFLNSANKSQDHLPSQPDYNHYQIQHKKTLSPSKEQQYSYEDLSISQQTTTTASMKDQQQQQHLSPIHSIDETKGSQQIPIKLLQPLKLELNNSNELPEAINEIIKPLNNKILSPRPLTTLEIEKNLINTAKTLEQPSKTQNHNNSKPNLLMKITSVETNEVIKIEVPKKRTALKRVEESNSIVFNFSDRQDVPDYVHNDGAIRSAKIEKPKVGEGGIILLPGASIDESFTDEEEELLRSLEAPPSPCDVTFINDNILIDGKSSLNQKTKRTKMKISFVESCPEIYEYPSESSLLIEETSLTTTTVNAQLGHTVPSLSGSSLANYTPKSTEDFQPGITRSVIPSSPSSSSSIKPKQDATTLGAENEAAAGTINQLVLEEVEQPILFSAGTNSDILF